MKVKRTFTVVKNVIDPEMVSSAISLYNETANFLKENGWYIATGTDPIGYWWRHPESAGTFSIGAADKE